MVVFGGRPSIHCKEGHEKVKKIAANYRPIHFGKNDNRCYANVFYKATVGLNEVNKVLLAFASSSVLL